MSQYYKTSKPGWSKKDVDIISKYKERIKDIEQLNLQKKLQHKEVNSIDFYKITPKEELPKFLQKMKFQTLHSKQNVPKMIKVFKKQRQTAQQALIRRKLRNEGKIMFLSEIYQNLGQSLEQKNVLSKRQASKFLENFGTDLEEWEKSKNDALIENIIVLKLKNCHDHTSRYKDSRIIQETLSQLNRKNSSGKSVNYFKQGSNYKKQIQKQLQIIFYTHSSQTNQVNKCVLIQNSSKLLKKQLDERQLQVQQQMKKKLKTLNQTRIQHHNLFQEKALLMLEERQCHEQILGKQQHSLSLNSTNNNASSSYYNSSIASSKLTQIKSQKRQQIEQNQSKIIKNKRMIESLENSIQNYEDQLRSIMIGEISYYKMILKIGMDCRDTGFGWVLKKLKTLLAKREKQAIVTNNSTVVTFPHKEEQYQFPAYLDKKSKQFLIVKTHLEDQLQQLMQQKRKFVNQIGQSSGNSNGNQGQNSKCLTQTHSGWFGQSGQDKISQYQQNTAQLPKKYRRSLRKITMLNQQYAKNQSLLELNNRKVPPSKNLELSANTDGLLGQRLYDTISQKIKYFDFTKAKKDKTLTMKNVKLLQYQSLLKCIKDIHLKLQDLDIQHQNHLTSHYKINKQIFFQQCAACFGYKRSYSMIIKYFSWKNGIDASHNV